MAETITFTLRSGRTKENVFLDAALSEGWTATIQNESTKMYSVAYAEFVRIGAADRVLTENGIAFSSVVGSENVEGIQNITYRVTEQIDNPLSQVDYGKRIVAKVFDMYDTDSAAKALKIRAAHDVADDNVTEVG